MGGGYYGDKYVRKDTTEVYSFRDNIWTEAGKLPFAMNFLRAATINNRVLVFGKYEYFIRFGYI